MNENKLRIMGKPVNDMYGSLVGSAVGTATDIDGTVTSVGVDCGLQGLLEIPIKHLVVQDESIIYVPQWRLDSQKVLREKTLLIRRLQALNTIIVENDKLEMDSEPIRQFYEEKLDELRDTEDAVLEALSERLAELKQQAGLAKSMHFDATIQYKSSEIVERDYKTVKAGTSTILERIEYETEEIKGMQERLEEQSVTEYAVRYTNTPATEDTHEEESVSADVSEESVEAPSQETLVEEIPIQEAPMTAVLVGATSSDVPPQAPQEEIPTSTYDIPESPQAATESIAEDISSSIPPQAPQEEIPTSTYDIPESPQAATESIAEDISSSIPPQAPQEEIPTSTYDIPESPQAATESIAEDISSSIPPQAPQEEIPTSTYDIPESPQAASIAEDISSSIPRPRYRHLHMTYQNHLRQHREHSRRHIE